MRLSTPQDELRALKDANELERLGYTQELSRSIGGFSNFAISFSIISILTGAVTLFGYGLTMGGPLEMTLGWPLATAGTLLVTLSMAELCSALPTSGGMYHWSAELGGPTWAWFTAWLNIVGLITAIAGIDYGCAEFLVPMLGLGSKSSTILIVYGLLLLSHALINHYGIRWVAYLNDFSVTVHILGVALLIGALWLFAPKQPLSFLLKATSSTSMHAPYFWLFLLGLLQAQWTYTGFDASAHVAEETVDPRRRAPWGMVTSVVVSGFFGYLLILSLAWVIPDIARIVNAQDAEGHPIPAVLAIVEGTLGGRAGRAVLILTVVAMWFCGLSAVTSLSRTIYAFARDKGLPLAGVWSRINPRHRTPAAAIWLSVALALAAMIYSGSYSVVTSISVVGFYLSYIIPVYLGWRRKSEWVEKRGPWHLGNSSNWINVFAVLWTVLICILMVMPPNTRAGLGIGGVSSGALRIAQAHRVSRNPETLLGIAIRSRLPGNPQASGVYVKLKFFVRARLQACRKSGLSISLQRLQPLKPDQVGFPHGFLRDCGLRTEPQTRFPVALVAGELPLCCGVLRCHRILLLGRACRAGSKPDPSLRLERNETVL